MTNPHPITVTAIPALSDNYIFALVHAGHVLLVDPGDATPALSFLEGHDLSLSGILVTHHHADHTAGISELRRHYSVPVFGPEKDHISSVTHPVKGNDILTISGFPMRIDVLAIPGHTLGHVAYLVGHSLFCGDTLFSAGCGRIFEGTPNDMYDSLQTIASLPDDTLIYCAHEYTSANLHFAATVEPDNDAIYHKQTWVTSIRTKGHPSIPATLAEEKTYNPFLRCHTPRIKKSVEAHTGMTLATPLDVFTQLRLWKNHYVIPHPNQ